MSITLVDHSSVLVVHAGLLPGVPLEKQQRKDMYSIRNVVECPPKASLRALDGVEEGRPWAEAWDLHVASVEGEASFVLFGHDAPRGLQKWKHAWGLDTNWSS